MDPRTFLLFMQPWVLRIFGTQVIKRKGPVRPVIPDYLSVSYDWFNEHLCLVYFRFQHRSKDILREKKLRYLIDSRSFPQSSIYKCMWHLQENSSILIKQTFKQIKLLEYSMRDRGGGGGARIFLNLSNFSAAALQNICKNPLVLWNLFWQACQTLNYRQVGIYI